MIYLGSIFINDHVSVSAELELFLIELPQVIPLSKL